MRKPTDVLNILKKYTPLIDCEINSLLKEQENLGMYDMMRYFFGYLDEELKPIVGYGGKRFRPGICLLLAEYLGQISDAIGAASAIEIFHNFTLIHDDIEDNDVMRRGRPTLWKKWGLCHGINTGDTQLILSFKELNRAYAHKPEILAKLNVFLTDIFQGVAEGQYQDFILAENGIDSDIVTEERYLNMIEKKSAILVAASAKVAGIICGVSDSELENLWQYGLNLGFAYQLNDDIVSIWANTETTGKNETGDIQERKKTLPILYLYEKLNKEQKAELVDIYTSKESLNQEKIKTIKNMLDEASAYQYVWDKIELYLEKSKQAALALNINDEQREILLGINKALVSKMTRNN